jgi:AraC-like DNA-binding protein
MLVVETGYLFSAYDTKIIILRYIYKSEPAPYGLIIHVTFMFPYLCNAICHTLSLLKLISVRKSVKDHKIIDVSIMHIVIGYVITVMFFFTYLLRSMMVLKYSIIAFSLSTVAGFMINQRYPEYLQLVIIESVKNRYRRSRLKGIDADNIIKRLTELMEKEKLYIDEDFSLKKLSYELSITPHQLSQLLNEKLNSNFNAYINQYRIREAKKMLIDEPDRSIISVSSSVGFNSKSSFYRSFTQSAGKTPYKYRKDMLSPKKQ